jgi:hypothetical protein
MSSWEKEKISPTTSVRQKISQPGYLCALLHHHRSRDEGREYKVVYTTRLTMIKDQDQRPNTKTKYQDKIPRQYLQL